MVAMSRFAGQILHCVPTVGSGTVTTFSRTRAHATSFVDDSMKNLISKAGHRHHRMLLLLFRLFSTCNALVAIDEAAQAREHMLTLPRVAQATTLLLAAYSGLALTDGLRKQVISLAAGLYDDRRSTLTFVDKPSRCPSMMGASPRTGAPLTNGGDDSTTSTSCSEFRKQRTSPPSPRHARLCRSLGNKGTPSASDCRGSGSPFDTSRGLLASALDTNQCHAERLLRHYLIFVNLIEFDACNAVLDVCPLFNTTAATAPAVASASWFRCVHRFASSRFSSRGGKGHDACRPLPPDACSTGVQAYFPKTPANFVQHFLEICHSNRPRSGVDLH